MWQKEDPVLGRIVLVLVTLCFRDLWNIRGRNPLIRGSCIGVFEDCKKGQHGRDLGVIKVQEVVKSAGEDKHMPGE